jgi:phosphomannomutase
VKVAVISGGAWPQFEQQVLAHLRHDACLRICRFCPPVARSSTGYDVSWELLYSEDFTVAERSTIIDSLQQAIASAGGGVERVWGEVIEDRGSQITFSALGQQAPLEEKKKWDPDFASGRRSRQSWIP